jgi:hypothetical protein
MKLNYLLIISTMFDLFSCKYDFPKPSDNWFATRIFAYESSAIDQNIIQIYLVDEKTGFLLGNDFEKVIDKGGTERDQTAYFFRSTDGGRSFEKQVLGKGVLEYISLSADKKSFYMVCARFGEYDTIKPSNYQILKSTDTGKTWEELYMFEDKNVAEVLFYNDSIGFASILEDPVGYDIKVLYCTKDGGKTWKPTAVDMDNKSLDLIIPEGKIWGQYVENEPAIWEMDINNLSIKRIPLDFSDSLCIASLMQIDPITKLHFVELRTKIPDDETGIEVEYFLLCIETGEKIKLPDNAFDYNVYGDYIGVLGGLKENYHIAQYYYSEDKGKSWKAETPKCVICSAAHCLYGKGYVWVTTPMRVDEIYCPLMVRIPPKEQVKINNRWTISD